MNSPNNGLNAVEARRKYTTRIQGNDYLKVAGRIILFRIDHPTGSILTEALSIDDNAAVFRASVWLDGVQLSSGHARVTLGDSKQAKGRYVEMAETNAIGRALGCIGYGTEEFATDDNDAIADIPVEPSRRKQSAPPKALKAPVDPRSPEGIAVAWAKGCTDEGVKLEHVLEALGVQRLREFDWSQKNALTIADELLSTFLATLSRANAPVDPPAAVAQSSLNMPATANNRHYDPALDAARN